MFNLIKAETYKLTKTKSLYVCLIILLAVAILDVMSLKFLVNFINEDVSGDMTTEMQQGFVDSFEEEDTISVGINSSSAMGFEDMTKPTAYEYYYMSFGSGETVVIFICIFASLFICSEYSNGTFKLTIAKGKGRLKTYLAKLTSISIVSSIYSILFILATVILSAIFFGWGVPMGGEEILRMLIYLVTVVFAHIAFGSLLTMLAFVLRSTAASIALGICGAMIVSLISQILYLLTDIDFIQYWISNAISSISTMHFTTEAIIKSLLLSASYLVGSTALGMYAFKRRDLK